MERVRFLCECGARIHPSFMGRHRLGRWHKVGKQARALRSAGIGYSEVARAVGLGKVFVHHMLRKEGL